MNEKLIPIGKYLKEFNNYLHYDLKEEIIYRSTGLEKHILKRHLNCLQYIGIIPIIVSNPDYIGINPNELQHCIQNGRLMKFDKTIEISYHQTT